MFLSTKNIVVCANRLNPRSHNVCQQFVNSVCADTKQIHSTLVRPNYAAVATLPIPNNIDVAETTRFSPNRTRDISATVLLSQYGQVPQIDITADCSQGNEQYVGNNGQQDPHVQSYDCFGAVSLNSAMQSNVPTPFGGMHKFSHLNMPGGQWSQESKFTSHSLHSSHYTTLRDNVRTNWRAYDQDATITKDATSLASKLNMSTNMCYNRTGIQNQIKRGYCSKTELDKQSKTLSKKDQLKKAFKDYGATIVVFHVALSLASLGCCYAMVSSGIDLVVLFERLGIATSYVSKEVAAGASTFVVAYAVHKVFAPIRISITLGATPFIVRFLRSKGYLKPKK